MFVESHRPLGKSFSFLHFSGFRKHKSIKSTLSRAPTFRQHFKNTKFQGEIFFSNVGALSIPDSRHHVFWLNLTDITISTSAILCLAKHVDLTAEKKKHLLFKGKLVSIHTFQIIFIFQIKNLKCRLT